MPTASRRHPENLSIDTQRAQQANSSSVPLGSAGTEEVSPTTENSEEAVSHEKHIALGEETGSDDDEDAPKRKNGANLGRRKIDIEYIDDKNKRHITFSKRKAGIMKKAYELSRLTGTEVLLLIVSETGLVYTFTTPRLSPLVTARRGKNLIQRCLSDDPHNSTGKEYPEPRMRQYMAPKGVVAQPMPTPSTRQPRRRAVSQPRRLPPPQPMTSVAESQRQELQENYAPYPSAHAAINMPPPSVESSSQREVKRRKTTENLRTGHDVESTAALPPMPVMPPPRPIPLAIPRSHRAERMLAEYCRFAGQRYQHHFDSEVPIIEGTFFVQFVSESFIIFDELQFSVDPMFVASQSPFKIRMPACLDALLRRGDNIECAIRKAQNASFWLPVSSGRIVEVPEGRISPDYLPQPQQYEAEMEHYRQTGDHARFAAAYNAFHKESRAANLLSLGEFDDEGFIPSEI